MSDTTIGASLQADDQVSPKVKNIRQELKLAQAEVVRLTEKFGATSKEAAMAAKKAAELKDKIQDASQLVDAFNPDTKFRAFGASIQTVVGGFSALTGIMGLLGVESENTQKMLLKVQSALAISQGVAQLQEGIQSFRNLALVVKAALGPIGLLVTAILAIGAGIFAWVTRTRDQTVAQKALNNTVKDYAAGVADATQKVEQVKVAMDLARKGTISKKEALKQYNETLGDSLGKTNDFALAEKNLADKAEAYIKITGLKAQANALFAESARKSAEAITLQFSDKITGKGFIKDLARQAQADAISGLKGVSDEIKKEAVRLETEAADLAKKSGVNKPGTLDEKKDAIKKEEEQLRSVIKNEKIKTALELAEDQARLDEQTKKRQEESTKLHIEKLSTLFKGFTGNLASLDIERTRSEQEQAAIRLLIAEQEYDAKIQFARDLGGALGALAELIGKQTAAGKVLAVAQATINTWLGVTEVLRTKSILPEPIATISRIANVAAIIATGLTAIKNIVKTQVPGASGGGSVSAPLQPQLATVTNTRLDQSQLNQIGNATARAFILESDIQNNRERWTRLNRAARL